jgi:hypothetical protein
MRDFWAVLGLDRVGASGLDGDEDRTGVPVGVDEGDLAGSLVYGDDVDAFEGDCCTVFAESAAGPLDGCGAVVDEDAVLGETDGGEEGEDAGDEGTDAFVADEGRRADGVVAGGGRGEGVYPAIGVHGAEGGEVFSDGLSGRVGHGWNCTWWRLGWLKEWER